jgi:hypothetical protein
MPFSPPEGGSDEFRIAYGPADVLGLLLGQLRQLRARFPEVQPGDVLVQRPRQPPHRLALRLGVRVQVELRLAGHFPCMPGPLALLVGGDDAAAFPPHGIVALEIGERTVSMSGRAPFYLGVLGHYHARSGAVDKVRDMLEELAGLAATRYVPPHCQAYIYAGANDLDRAFEWQARAYDDGASPFCYFSALIENLHTDPRHGIELRRMGLPKA